jgi:hypothetical protein
MNWAHCNPDDDTSISRRSSRGPKKKSNRQRARGNAPPLGRFLIERSTYTSGQAAHLLRIPARTLRRYLSVGKLVGIQNPITQTWHISSEALIDFIESQGGEAIVRKTQITVLVIDRLPDLADMLERMRDQDRPELVIHLFEEVGDGLIESGVRRPELIVVNATSPFYDGVGLIKLLRNNPHLRSSKIMAIVDEHRRVERSDSLRGIALLQRPVTYADLLSTLNDMFEEWEALSSER